MMKIKKRAYLATLAILAALGGMAYYSNRQSKQFELDFSGSDNTSIWRRPKNLAPSPQQIDSPQPVPTPAPTPQPIPESDQAAPAKPEKSKSYIIEVDQYGTQTGKIEVPKGYKANLVIKTDTYRSGKGLSFQAPGEFPVLIKPGETKTLSFTPEENFDLEVYLGTTHVLAPYKIEIFVK